MEQLVEQCIINKASKCLENMINDGLDINDPDIIKSIMKNADFITISHIVDQKLINTNNKYIIKYACLNHDENVLKLILGQINNNDIDEYGTLIFCCKHYCLTQLKKSKHDISIQKIVSLLNFGANPNINQGTPLKIAISFGSEKLINILILHGAEMNVVNESISYDMIPTVERNLLNSGLNIETLYVLKTKYILSNDYQKID